MPRGNGRKQRPVHFLGERRVGVARPQPGFDMPNRQLMIISAEPAKKRARSIALHEHRGDFVRFQEIAELRRETTRKFG